MLQIQVHDIERFTEAVARCVAISRTEHGTIHYDWFFDQATRAARLVEAYESVVAVLAHVHGPVSTDVGPDLPRTCTFVSMDAFGDTGALAEGAEFWPSTYWGTPFAELVERTTD